MKPIAMRPIPGFERYLAAEDGEIYDTRTRRFVTQHKDAGYMRAGIATAKGRKNKHVHRLVALAFLGQPPTPKHEVCHWDGNRANNRIANLRWGTRSENTLDTSRHGRNPRQLKPPVGELSQFAVLSEAQVRAIRKLRSAGVAPSLLAEAFSITADNVRKIVTRKTWKHVA